MMFIRNSNREENQEQEVAQGVSLVKRAASGDSEAFAELYSTYFDRIYRYVVYQLRDQMTAEDVTEETFIKAWKAIGSCKGKEKTFSSWLYRIAHNQAVDFLRKQREYVSTEMEDLAKVGSYEPKEQERLEQYDMLAAVSNLPPNQKQVIILRFIDGLANQEVAQIMGKRQGAVRMLQTRALASLRQILSSGEL